MAEHRPAAEIQWTRSASDALREIGSRTIQQKIVDKVTDLAHRGQPELLGKPLVDQFQGLYRISFGRYRIVYRVIRDAKADVLVRVIVRVMLVGIRKQGDKRDIYERLRRLILRNDV